MLTNEQLEDLAQFHVIAGEFGAEVVIIGAAALLCFIELGRFTRDVDLVVALDLEDFAAFSGRLSTQRWTEEPRKEHRWRGPRGSIIDLIPAGPNLRASRRIVWPTSQFEMSLVGFEHVFARASLLKFAQNMQYKVAPLPVLALLKIVSFMDDPHRRQKDLDDLRALFRLYEAGSDRLFGDQVFAAGLGDFEYANAFLLGMDVGGFGTHEDAEVLNAFLADQHIADEDLSELDRDDVQQSNVVLFQQQLRAFQKGFDRSRSARTS